MCVAGVIFILLVRPIIAAKDDVLTCVVSTRVVYTKVEQQLKLWGIPYMHVNPPAGEAPLWELVHLKSSLAHSVPALCVQASHILSGVPAAEAAMSNI
jgi:mediator of RNA polymerase II transcription subunit 14